MDVKYALIQTLYTKKSCLLPQPVKGAKLAGLSPLRIHSAVPYFLRFLNEGIIT